MFQGSLKCVSSKDIKVKTVVDELLRYCNFDSLSGRFERRFNVIQRDFRRIQRDSLRASRGCMRACGEIWRGSKAVLRRFKAFQKRPRWESSISSRRFRGF